MRLKRKALATLGVVGAVVGLSIAGSPAHALGSNAASCGYGNMAQGYSASSTAYTTASGTLCGTLQVSVQYGTKCGVRSSIASGTGIVYRNIAKTCNGQHKGAKSVWFYT